jgi:hypothetical protein
VLVSFLQLYGASHAFFDAFPLHLGHASIFMHKDEQYVILGIFFKERLFGLTNSEGNHGEDVKEAEELKREKKYE